MRQADPAEGRRWRFRLRRGGRTAAGLLPLVGLAAMVVLTVHAGLHFRQASRRVQHMAPSVAVAPPQTADLPRAADPPPSPPRSVAAATGPQTGPPHASVARGAVAPSDQSLQPVAANADQARQ